MSEGIDIDPDDVRAAADEIRGTKDEVQTLANYARDADPDPMTWGAIGMVYFAPIYHMIVENVHDRIAGFEGTIEGFASMLEECAQEAEDCDDDMSNVFIDLDNRIED